ncbi:hypothetical protein [Rhodopila sp.]|uniref:hypothetical protein n=1 Tax=Rhodopila sp. TaxID=2480087 RepID=UPI003D0D5C88
MPAPKPPSSDKKPQFEHFIEAARDLGCDENEAAFRAKLAVIARQKPKHKKKPIQG